MADIIIDVETRANLRPLGEGLSAATAKASEFEKSINAANARVLAFGASAGLIYKIGEAFTGLVKSTIEVEKSLTDVNTLLGKSQSQLANFGAELFSVAKQTSQSFATVAEAAKELARQGLTSEQTLERTSEAMNLMRLSGLDASSSVETLTAVLNTFSQAGLNATSVVEKMAAVDAKFAVSSNQLAEGLKRSSAAAVDAGVSYEELLGVITVVQERTARGGAVIGNAFKTIFTKLGRPEVLDDLQNLGIKVRDIQGEILPSIQILKNLASSYESLGPASKSFISEQIAGIYQIGTLKALMADLSKENSRFAETQLVAADSSGSTAKRVAELNTHLDAYINRLGTAAKAFAAAFGAAGFNQGLKDLVGFGTSVLESLTPDPSKSEEIGNKIGVGIMKGLGGFLTGPGLLGAGFIGGKILVKFFSDAAQAAHSLASIGNIINKELQQRQSLETAIALHLQKQPGYIDQIRNGTLNVSTAQDQILLKLKQEEVLRQKILAISSAMAPGLIAGGVGTTPRGRLGLGTKSKGHIPQFARREEISGAIEGGYMPGQVVRSPVGGVMNTAESLKYASGFTQPFINPPKDSKAGRAHRTKALGKTGIDPYSAGGFVPNYALTGYRGVTPGVGDVNRGFNSIGIQHQLVAALGLGNYTNNPQIAQAYGKEIKKKKIDGDKLLNLGKYNDIMGLYQQYVPEFASKIKGAKENERLGIIQQAGKALTKKLVSEGYSGVRSPLGGGDKKFFGDQGLSGDLLIPFSGGFVPNFYIKGLAGRMNTSGGDAAILEGRIFEALLNNKKTLDLAENKVGPDITEGKYKNHEAKRTGMAAFNDSNFGLGKAKGGNLVLPQDASADYDQVLTKQKKASIKRAAGYPMSRLRDLAHKTIKAESSKDTDYRNVPIQFSSGFIPNFARILDFDGTLGKAPEGITHKDTYHGWSASKMIPTPLVDKIRKEQQATLKAGKKIDDVVLTARSRESIPFIAAWLKEQGLSATEIIATGDKERYPEGMTTPAKKAMEMKERGLIAPGNTFHDDDKKNLTAGRRAAKEAGIKGFKTSKANYGNKGIGQMASGFVPNFAEFFKYPFTQKIRGRDRPVPPSEISGRYKEYEDQLFKGGLASLGFSDVNDLNKLFNSNVEADFFARRNDNPYIIDAKAGYNDAQAGSYMKKIGPGGTFAKLKSNPKFLDFLTSKGVSVNNLREAMVFGNMGVSQENTLSKRGLMKASGFVPNFGENTPGKIGEGARMEAYRRGEDVFKAPKKTGSRRGEAVVDAKEQEALSQQYSEALSKFPWFKVLKQKHVGGGVLKQPLVAGQTLSKVLRRAYPNYGERAISGALGSITKFFNKIGLPYDGFGLAGNIIIPEEHQKHLIEVLQKEPGNLYAKMFGHKGGLPPGSLNMIDYAKGFIPNFGMNLDDADQEFIRANIKGIRRADKIGALNFGSPFMMAKAGGPATYEQLAGFGDPRIADRLRGIVGKKGGRAAVLKSISAAGGFVPNFGPLEVAKGLGIVAIKALVGQILGDDIIDAAERAQLHKLGPKDAKLAFDEFMSRPPRSRHRRAFERARREDPTLFPSASSGGFVPNFASYMDNVAGLEAGLSGEKATFHTSPFPHFRNESQPTFASAMNDHGGLSNALKDSVTGQKAAGLMAAGGVPNFAAPYKFKGKPLEIDPNMAGGFAEGLRAMAARQAQAKAEFEKIIQALRSSAITAEKAREQFEALKNSAGLTAASQKRLGAIVDKNVKAAAAASAAGEKSGGIMGFIRGTDGNGKKLEGDAATNRSVKMGALSMGFSALGGVASEVYGAESKVGRGISAATSVLGYGATGAMVGGGLPGALVGGGIGIAIELGKYFSAEKLKSLAEAQDKNSASLNSFETAIKKARDASAEYAAATTEAAKKAALQKLAEAKVEARTSVENLSNRQFLSAEESKKALSLADNFNANEKEVNEFIEMGKRRQSALTTLSNKDSKPSDLESARKSLTSTYTSGKGLEAGEELLKNLEAFVEKQASLDAIIKKKGPSRFFNTVTGKLSDRRDQSEEEVGLEVDLKELKNKIPALLRDSINPNDLKVEIEKIKIKNKEIAKEIQNYVSPDFNAIRAANKKLEEAILKSAFEFEKAQLGREFLNTGLILRDDFNVKLKSISGTLDVFEKTTGEFDKNQSQIQNNANATRLAMEDKVLRGVRTDALTQARNFEKPEVRARFNSAQAQAQKEELEALRADVAQDAAKALFQGADADLQLKAFQSFAAPVQMQASYTSPEDTSAQNAILMESIFKLLAGAKNVGEAQGAISQGQAELTKLRNTQGIAETTFKDFNDALEKSKLEIQEYERALVILGIKTENDIRISEVKRTQELASNQATIMQTAASIKAAKAMEDLQVALSVSIRSIQMEAQSRGRVQENRDRLEMGLRRQSDTSVRGPGRELILNSQENVTRINRERATQAEIENKTQAALEKSLAEASEGLGGILGGGTLKEKMKAAQADVRSSIDKDVNDFADDVNLGFLSPEEKMNLFKQSASKEEKATLLLKQESLKSLETGKLPQFKGKEEESKFYSAVAPSLGLDANQIERLIAAQKIMTDQTKSTQERNEAIKITQELLKEEGSKLKDNLAALEKSRDISNIVKGALLDLERKSDPIANLQRDMDQLTTSMQKGFEDAFVGFVEGTASAGDAFKGFVRGIAQEIVRMSAKFTANLVMSNFMQGANQIGSALFGGKSEGGLIKANSGGYITGGSGYKDDLPAMLTGGEYVLKKSAVNKYGVDFLNNVNAQKFAAGGQVLDNKYTLGTFSGDYAKGDSAKLAGAYTGKTMFVDGADIGGGSFTMGQYNMDPRLSNIALTDENNPQNRLREEQAQLDRDRKNAFEDYSTEKRFALDSFKKEKDDRTKAAYINAAVQIGMMGLQAGLSGGKAGAKAGEAKADSAAATAEADLQGYEGTDYNQNMEAAGPLSKSQAASISRGDTLNASGYKGSVGPTSYLGGFMGAFTGNKPQYQVDGSAIGGDRLLSAEEFQGHQTEFATKQGLSPQAQKQGFIAKQFDSLFKKIAPETYKNEQALKRMTPVQKQQNAFTKYQEANRGRGAYQGKALGGSISGGKDDVPALLMGGEYVMSKSAVSKYGANFMDKLNKGNVQGFAAGGRVGEAPDSGAEGQGEAASFGPDLLLAIEGLTAEIKNKSGGDSKSSGSGGITNNVTVNINVTETGKVTGSNETSGEGGEEKEGKNEKDGQEDQKKRKDMADTIQALIITTLIKEQRAGGLLEKTK